VAAELGSEVYAEVTFAVKVNDGDYTPIGTDNNPPYRVFYDVTSLPEGRPWRSRPSWTTCPAT